MKISFEWTEEELNIIQLDELISKLIELRNKQNKPTHLSKEDLYTFFNREQIVFNQSKFSSLEYNILIELLYEWCERYNKIIDQKLLQDVLEYEGCVLMNTILFDSPLTVYGIEIA